MTDALEYRLRYVTGGDDGYYDAEAIGTYVNRTDAPVHFERCDSDDEIPIVLRGVRREGLHVSSP